MTRAWVSWSSGKDSVFALQLARASVDTEVVGLLTSINETADRVAMHAVRRDLLLAQARRVELPLHVVELPVPCPNEVYEARVRASLAAAVAAGVEQVLFGDVFLAEVRAYREQLLTGTGIAPGFPLWGRPTGDLARAMLDAGMRAILTCVDPAQLPKAFVGRPFDRELLADLPAGVDPLGEHGEFHTFVWDGPGFREPVHVEVGEVVERGGFVFCDLLPNA